MVYIRYCFKQKKLVLGIYNDVWTTAGNTGKVLGSFWIMCRNASLHFVAMYKELENIHFLGQHVKFKIFCIFNKIPLKGG